MKNLAFVFMMVLGFQVSADTSMTGAVNVRGEVMDLKYEQGMLHLTKAGLPPVECQLMSLLNTVSMGACRSETGEYGVIAVLTQNTKIKELMAAAAVPAGDAETSVADYIERQLSATGKASVGGMNFTRESCPVGSNAFFIFVKGPEDVDAAASTPCATLSIP